MKASGFAIKPLLQQKGYNAVRIDNKHVRLGKYNRVEQSEPFLASERVVLIQGGYIQQFLSQCTAFPNGAHDDLVDVLTYPILKYFIKAKKAAKTNYRN
jgi:predicted phage terminase large subunit-like protein